MADNGKRREGSAAPDERYREFAKENAEWDRKVEETLTELDEPRPERPTPSEKDQPAPA